MWKWQLVKDVDVSFWYIIFFTAIGLGLVYGINFIYRKIKK